MKNLDTLNAEKIEVLTNLGNAMTSEDENEVVKAMSAFAEHVQNSVLAEARGLQSASDTSILAGRGTNQLTSEENQYYTKLIAAMKSSNPKMELENIDAVLPKTTIERVFEDLTVSHPLLNAIQFHNTTVLNEWIEHDHETQLAAWGDLTDKIIAKITSAFTKIDMKMFKLSAFMVISQAMLDLGPQWIDRYVRVILAEAVALAIEESSINGTGNKMPIGMNRQVGKDVTITSGEYPLRDKVKLDSFDPVSYGKFVAEHLATTAKGNPRIITEMICIVNPIDYLEKIMPATTVRTPLGTYVNNVFPLPTNVIQSVRMPKGEAIIGFGERYFIGIGAGTDGGRIEYSDEYKFLEDQRVYRVKMYGNGTPLDNTSFALVDISGLLPMVQQVFVTNIGDANFPVI